MSGATGEADMGDQASQEKAMLWEKSSDFEEHFDPQAYASFFYGKIEPDSWMEKVIKDFHKIFTTGRSVYGKCMAYI